MVAANFGQPPSSRMPGWHYEYGSATAFFVLPRESRAHLFSAANGDGASEATGEAVGGVEPPGRSRGAGTGREMRVEEMPADENGVRDLLQVKTLIYK